jgi:hypothetical protein
MSGLVDVRGDVIRVVPRGFADHGPDGPVRLDQSVVRVTGPAELAGRTLTIVLDDGSGDALLRREGGVAFLVDGEDLDLDVLFSGALTDVRDPASGAAP